MDDGFRWFGDEARAALAGAARAGLMAGAEVYRSAMHEALTAIDNEGPSVPGEVPHGQSEEAARRGRAPMADALAVYEGDSSDAQSRDEVASVAVGTPARQAAYLETGTADTMPRPSWGPVAADRAGDIGAAIEADAAAAFAAQAGG
jgi:hypothetical protein